MDHHRGRLVGDQVFDLGFHLPTGYKNRPGNGTLLEFVRLPDVEHHGVAGAAHRVGRLGVDLANLGLCCCQEITESGHGEILPIRSGLPNPAGEPPVTIGFLNGPARVCMQRPSAPDLP